MGLGAILTFVLMIFALLGYRHVKPNERLAVYRLSQFVGLRSSGVTWIIPFVDKAVRVDLDQSVPEWKSLDSSSISSRVESWVSENVRA